MVKDIKKYMALPYRLEIVPDEDEEQMVAGINVYTKFAGKGETAADQ